MVGTQLQIEEHQIRPVGVNGLHGPVQRTRSGLHHHLPPAVARMMLTAVLLDARRPQRLLERSFMVYRRTWLILVSGFELQRRHQVNTRLVIQINLDRLR